MTKHTPTETQIKEMIDTLRGVRDLVPSAWQDRINALLNEIEGGLI